MVEKLESRSTGGLRHCIFAFGIPTSRTAFFADQKRDDKDYARQFDGVWYRYYHTVIRAVQRVEPYFTGWGVKVVHNLELHDFGNLLRLEDVSVITLVTHWKEFKEDQNREDEIEFSDGLASVSEVIAEIPRSYTGIIDLCICHPNQLTNRLKRERSIAVVRSSPGKATLYYWLYFYLALFKQMHNKNVSYMQAFEDVFTKFFELHRIL